jgi:hypothetical protein
VRTRSTCAAARPIDEYVVCLEEGSIAVDGVEPHDEALVALVEDVRRRRFGVEVLIALRQLDLSGADFDTARIMARAAGEAVRRGQVGYVLIAGTRKPE